MRQIMEGKNDAAAEAKNSYATTVEAVNYAQRDHFYTRMPAVFDVSDGLISGYSCNFNILSVAESHCFLTAISC